MGGLEGGGHHLWYRVGIGFWVIDLNHIHSGVRLPYNHSILGFCVRDRVGLSVNQELVGGRRRNQIGSYK